MDDDDVLSELMNEIDETGDAPSGNSTASSVLSEKQANREYMRTFSIPKRPSLPPVSALTNKENRTQKPINKSPPVLEEEKQPEEINIPEDTAMDCSEPQDSVFDDDFDVTQIEEFEAPAEGDKVTEEQLLQGWETMQQGVENVSQSCVVVNTGELPVVQNEDGQQVAVIFLLKN